MLMHILAADLLLNTDRSASLFFQCHFSLMKQDMPEQDIKNVRSTLPSLLTWVSFFILGSSFFSFFFVLPRNLNFFGFL